MKIKVDNIDINSILTSGACFRCIKEEDGSFTNIIKDRVINLYQKGKYIFVKSSNYDNLDNIIKEYFGLNRNYDYINSKIIEYYQKFNDIVTKCKNYRILNQDSFEMCVSYIISQNNNVKRISKSINEISKDYGTKIIFNKKEYHLFPTYEQLKSIKIDELKKYGVGFRDKYIYDFLCKYSSLQNLNNLSTTDALNELLKVKGIGMKVASCILLFGYKRFDVFPIDTWVKQYISNNYNIKNTQKEIENFVRTNCKEYSGLVIQYMYHSERNLK